VSAKPGQTLYGEARMSKFEFFFAFYGLLLGLGVAELLQGVGSVVRARRIRAVGVQTGLMALGLLVVMMLTWLDAWTSLQRVELNMGSLVGPVAVAVCYYLAAVVVFPKAIEEWESLDAYYAERKRYAVGLMIIAEVLITFVIFRDYWAGQLRDNPERFWQRSVPINAAILLTFAILFLARRRAINMGAWIALILLFTVPYWNFEQPHQEESPAAAGP
jgi:hypothetical protein